MLFTICKLFNYVITYNYCRYHVEYALIGKESHTLIFLTEQMLGFGENQYSKPARSNINNLK